MCFFLNFASLTKPASIFYHSNGYLFARVAKKHFLANEIVMSVINCNNNNAKRYLDSRL